MVEKRLENTIVSVPLLPTIVSLPPAPEKRVAKGPVDNTLAWSSPVSVIVGAAEPEVGVVSAVNCVRLTLTAFAILPLLGRKASVPSVT